ncbi:uncharacterized protein LOC134281188 [Saccostrea cucullata]|uniref:uncharacterized protein LOC134281188 n=1 Tax=Saccostrea cuccullata TaxID=36930 RepID=UPI002ED0A5A9
MTFRFLILFFFLIPNCCLGLLFHGQSSTSNSSADGQNGNKLDDSLIHQLLAKDIAALENKLSGLAQKVATLERTIYDDEIQNFTQEINNIRKQTKLCEQKLQAYEEREANDTVKWQNIMNVVDKFKDQVRYAAVSLLDVSEKTKEINSSLTSVIGNLTNLQGDVSTVQYNVSNLFSILNSLQVQLSDSSKKSGLQRRSEIY